MSSNSSSSAGRHPTYRGVRRRSGGKWVSEIREPKKPNRIWLGTFPSPEMAAVAYDVAARALKGRDAKLNFPNLVESFPIPVSTSPRDIQAAAANAAAAAGAAADSLSVMGGNNIPIIPVDRAPIFTSGTGSNSYNYNHHEFVDEELIFNMPNLLRNMAEGLLLSPPRLDYTAAGDDDQNMSTYSGDNHNLWSYYP